MNTPTTLQAALLAERAPRLATAERILLITEFLRDQAGPDYVPTIDDYRRVDLFIDRVLETAGRTS
jgi:hypothetical protein